MITTAQLAGSAWALQQAAERHHQLLTEFHRQNSGLKGSVLEGSVLEGSVLEEETKPSSALILPFAPTPVVSMTAHQEEAWQKITAWLGTKDPFFTLKGVAGSGKSFLIGKLATLSHNFLFAAPTNKATKVLSDFLGFPCKTIYSLLGFRMEANEENLELSDLKELPKLGNSPIFIIDEAGMIPKFLVQLFKKLAAERGWRFLFVGDPYQWNPIGERTSGVWALTKEKPTCRAMMTEVKRFDNQLLKLSVNIRACIKARNFEESPIVSDNADGEGVFTTSRHKLMTKIKEYDVEFWKTSKVACWRNRTVNSFNDTIRSALGFRAQFAPTELILAGAPVLKEGVTLAYTDEEFQVVENQPQVLTFEEGTMEAHSLVLKDKDFRLTVPSDVERYQRILASRAATARSASAKERRSAWNAYWEFRNTFHTVRYGYAMTSHRLQGSTLDSVFLDEQDVLANRDDLEAFRGLYVIATRPTQKLVAFS